MSDMQIPLFDDSKPVPPRPEWGEQLLQPIPIQKDQATSPAELVPEEAEIRVTNSYEVTNILLSRFLLFFRDEKKPDSRYIKSKISSELAIPSERIRSLMIIARKAELLMSDNSLSTLGRILLTHDQFLLNQGTLWFLHYLLSSNASAVIWSRLFNTVFYEVEEVAPIDITTYFSDVQGRYSEKVFALMGRHDLGAVLRTYTESIFKPLGLMVKFDKGRYTIITTDFGISPYIWLASILAYRERYYPGAASLETHLLVDAHFSPGRLFRQKEEVVRQALEKLHTQGLITVETRLGLDQVRFKREITWISAIAQYFEEGK